MSVTCCLTVCSATCTGGISLVHSLVNATALYPSGFHPTAPGLYHNRNLWMPQGPDFGHRRSVKLLIIGLRCTPLYRLVISLSLFICVARAQILTSTELPAQRASTWSTYHVLGGRTADLARPPLSRGAIAGIAVTAAAALLSGTLALYCFISEARRRRKNRRIARNLDADSLRSSGHHDDQDQQTLRTAVLPSVYPQPSHHITEMAHTDLGSPFSDPFQDTNIETDHGPSPHRETVVYSPSTPGERDDGDLAGSVPTPRGVTEGTTTPEKTSRPSSFIPSTPVSACYDSDEMSLKTSSTLPPSYRTRRSIPDLISAPRYPLPPLPNQNNYPRAPPSAYPGPLEFYQRPNAIVETGETLDDRRVLPDVPDHEGDSDDERRGGSRNGSQARYGRKRCMDGGIRLDGGPVGYVSTVQSPAVDVEAESQAGESTRPPSYNQTS